MNMFSEFRITFIIVLIAMNLPGIAYSQAWWENGTVEKQPSSVNTGNVRGNTSVNPSSTSRSFDSPRSWPVPAPGTPSTQSSGYGYGNPRPDPVEAKASRSNSSFNRSMNSTYNNRRSNITRSGNGRSDISRNTIPSPDNTKNSNTGSPNTSVALDSTPKGNPWWTSSPSNGSTQGSVATSRAVPQVNRNTRRPLPALRNRNRQTVNTRIDDSGNPVSSFTGNVGSKVVGQASNWPVGNARNSPTPVSGSSNKNVAGQASTWPFGSSPTSVDPPSYPQGQNSQAQGTVWWNKGQPSSPQGSPVNDTSKDNGVWWK